MNAASTGPESGLKRFLPKGAFGRGVTLIAAGAAAGQAVIALASPFLTRLYSVRELGIYAIYASLMGTLLPAASLRYELAIPLPERDEDGANVLVVALLALLAVCALLLIPALSLGGDVARLVKAPIIANFLWVVPITLFAAGSYQALSYWGVRKGSFGIIGRARVVQAGGQVAAQVSAGALGAGAGGMVFGDLIGRCAGSASYVVSLVREKPGVLHGVSASSLRGQARRYRRFPLFGTWSALTNSAGLHLTPFLIAAAFGPESAGWFTVGQRVMALPLTVIGMAMSQVYLHEAAVQNRRPGAHLEALFRSTTRKLLMVGTVLVVPAAILAPFVFPALFGPGWREAGVYMQLAGVMFLVQFIVGPVSQTLNVLARQDLQLAWDVGRLVVMIGVFVLAHLLGWSARATILTYSVLMAVAYGVLYALTAIEVRKVSARG